MNLPKIPNSYNETPKPEIVTYKNRDLASAIHRAGDMKEDLLFSFKHGQARGETTHIKELNPHFTWKPGFLYCGTGYPSHGKSEGTRYLALLKSVFEGKKWGFYVPEEFPAKSFWNSLIHTYVGKTTDPEYPQYQMSIEEYKSAIDFIHEHFFFVHNHLGNHTPEYLRQVTRLLHDTYKIYGFVKDPWNKCAHLWPKGVSRDDQYLSIELPKEQLLARELQIVQIINAHPHGIKREKGKPWPVPDAGNLAGGVIWEAMCDVIYTWHRSNFWYNKADTLTELHIHKVKEQKLVGIPGSVEFDYDRPSARYLINGRTPLNPHIVTPQKSIYDINNLPDNNEFEYREPDF